MSKVEGGGRVVWLVGAVEIAVGGSVVEGIAMARGSQGSSPNTQFI